MKDKIYPGSSEYVETTHLDDNWERIVFSDGVVWRYRNDDLSFQGDYYQVARWPFVPGYFLSKVSDAIGQDECDVPINPTPFRSLEAAMAAVIVLGPHDDADTDT